MSRAGSKRKFRGTSPGRSSIDPGPQYRLLSSLQPHRRDLPPDSRLDPNASTELGRLFIRAQITREQHIAGDRWSYTVAAFLATLGAPKGVGSSGRGGQCVVGPEGCHAEECACEKRRRAYQSGRSMLFGLGKKTSKLIDDVVIWGDECSPESLAALRVGLSALAQHFGVT
jgi:hypothetical protein